MLVAEAAFDAGMEHAYDVDDDKQPTQPDKAAIVDRILAEHSDDESAMLTIAYMSGIEHGKQLAAQQADCEFSSQNRKAVDKYAKFED